MNETAMIQVERNTQTDGRSQSIQAAASRIAARRPELAAAADKAAAIVERGGVARRNRWQVEVTGDRGETYDVQFDDEGRLVGCTCPAFYYRPVVINDKAFCKHILAVIIERRVNEEA